SQIACDCSKLRISFRTKNIETARGPCIQGVTMDFEFNQDQRQLREAVLDLCTQFDGQYWLRKDSEGGFPEEFYQAFAQAGWLGIAMPEEYGGAGLGITEAS